MEISIDDVRNLTFELYMTQREVHILREANKELTELLKQQENHSHSHEKDW